MHPALIVCFRLLSYQLDRAAEFLANYRAEHGEVPPLTPKEEKAMIRRFDLLLVPLLVSGAHNFTFISSL